MFSSCQGMRTDIFDSYSLSRVISFYLHDVGYIYPCFLETIYNRLPPLALHPCLSYWHLMHSLMRKEFRQNLALRANAKYLSHPKVSPCYLPLSPPIFYFVSDSQCCMLSIIVRLCLFMRRLHIGFMSITV